MGKISLFYLTHSGIFIQECTVSQILIDSKYLVKSWLR